MDIEALLADQNPWWADPAQRAARAFPARRDLQPQILETVLRVTDRRASVILGPRQVGKTILLRQVVDDLILQGWPTSNICYFDFSDDRITSPLSPRELASFEPRGLREDHPRAFLLDEIGRFPRWAEWLKQAVDQEAHRYVATDSAASLLVDDARESGAGRWDEHELETLTFIEALRLRGLDADQAFASGRDPLELYLRTGGFPEFIDEDDYALVRSRLRADVAERAILRDLARHGLDVGSVKALFVYLAQDSGAIFDASARARDLDSTRETVNQYRQRLLDTRLIHGLRRRTPRHPSAQLRSKPKIYACDHSLVGAFSEDPHPLENPRTRGQVVEACVFRHLRDLQRLRGGSLSYLRNAQRHEIDFVFEHPDGVAAIEVTAQRHPRRKLASLRKAAESLEAALTFMIHRGLDDVVEDDVRLLPLHRFLAEPTLVLESPHD